NAQESITPGQSAVLYDRDVLLGGGIIEAVLRQDKKEAV
ncbi:MAG: aminomethyltransferase beta-barrel domain-containing protein, partial [Candidatus Omnitrophota bacterium]